MNNFQTLMKLCSDNKISATEFELTFLMAALHFKQSNCEAVVLEVTFYESFLCIISMNFVPLICWLAWVENTMLLM